MGKFNFYMAAAISAWLLAIMVIAKELSEPFAAFLATTFSHHWIGKSVIIALVFIVVGFLLKGMENDSDKKTGWYSVLAALIVILLFYIIEFII